MRTKKTTLFNKNHITLEKIELNPVETYFYCGHGYITGNFITKSSIETDARTAKERYGREPKNKKQTRFELKVSEHGFYYSVPIVEPRVVRDKSGYRKTSKWIFHIDDVLYILTFLSTVDEVTIDKETRPWQLCDKAMEDHFITDLLTELEKVTELAKEKKLRCYSLWDLQQNWRKHGSQPDISDFKSTSTEYYFTNDASSTKRTIYEMLFGDPDGPKYQTNEEKILAHGFDLKTSFRKM